MSFENINNNKSPTVSVRIDAEILQMVKDYCAQDRRSIRSFFEVAALKFIAENKPALGNSQTNSLNGLEQDLL